VFLCYLSFMNHFLVFLCLLLSINSLGQHGFFTGRTTGLLPFLEYGLGDDRLGGAKMTYLDSNIVMKVVDSVKDDYKVQLSAYHSAWLAHAPWRRLRTRA
jgi:N-acetylmuramoyl-L-alanine amidase